MSGTRSQAPLTSHELQERPEVLEHMKLAGLKVSAGRATDADLREAYQHLPWCAASLPVPPPDCAEFFLVLLLSTRKHMQLILCVSACAYVCHAGLSGLQPSPCRS